LLSGHDIKKNLVVSFNELHDHPGTVGADPKRNGEVVRQLGGNATRSPGNENGYKQSGNGHSDAHYGPTHTPAQVFDDPKNNV
jgi:hypothetical protein